MLRCGRQPGRVIAGLRIHVAGGTTLLIGTLQRILMQLGAPPQLVFTTRAGREVRRDGAGNVRSRPAPPMNGVPSTARDVQASPLLSCFSGGRPREMA
jgi:hypothetical protein